MKKIICITLLLSICLMNFALAQAPASTTVSITIGGDCVLGTRKTYETSPDTFDTYMQEKGYSWPFRHLIHLFKEDDLTYVNLEGVFKDDAEHYVQKEFSFRGPQDYAKILKLSSIEHVNIANNHIDDYGKQGRQTTLAALEQEGIAYSGFKNTFVFEKDGYKIGFAGCRETMYKESSNVVAADIKALKKLGCDVIIYSFHWGKEYSLTHNQLQEKMADFAIKRGANIVIGTHPHCLQGIDYRNGALVIYSLGNLVFGGTLDMTTFDAMLARLNLQFEDGQYKGVSMRILPVLTSGSIPKNDFSPIPAKDEDYRRIMGIIQQDSSMTLTSDMFFPVKEKKATK